MSGIKNVIGREKIKIDLREYADILKNASEYAQLEIEVTIGISENGEIRAFNQRVANGASSLNPKYVFDSLIDGEFNHIACAAARNVAQNFGGKNNPLYLYGKEGLGKTHLLHAIGNEVLKNNPEKVVRYITGEQFSNEFRFCIMNDITRKFRRIYRAVDLLLIDDFQRFNRSAYSQEELLNTFVELINANKQIVIAGNCQPQNIEGLNKKILSRLPMTLVFGIKLPGFKEKINFLKKKAAMDGIIIPDEAVKYIARNIESNIGELKGGLAKVVAYAEVMGQDITVDLATEALKGIVK